MFKTSEYGPTCELKHVDSLLLKGRKGITAQIIEILTNKT